MPAEVRIPTLGESVREGVIARWLKPDGTPVRADEPLLELETDKANVEIPAPQGGVLRILKQQGETVQVGDVVARLEERASAPSPPPPTEAKPAAPAPVSRPAQPPPDEVERVPMTPLRQRIAERLVQAQHTAAILTTFNEVDMTAVMEWRSRHKARFAEVHKV